jgi:hypothetical protein
VAEARGVEGGLIDGPGLLHHDATVHGAVPLEEGADGAFPVDGVVAVVRG